MEFEYKEVYKYPISTCLNITDSCNLACKYCFVQQHPHFITLDLAKQAIDWLVNNLLERQKIRIKENEQVHLTFFGGEPMLLYEEIIVPLVNYIEKTYPNKIKLNITTNGTLLNKERVDFFVKHNIGLLLSIDGDKTTQDFNRPQRNGEGSFDLIEKNISYLLKKKPYTTFRSTLYQPTVKYLYENYKYAEKRGFKNIFFCPNAREKWTEQNIEILKEQLNKIFTDRIFMYLKGKEPINCSPIDEAYEQLLQHDLQVFNNEYNDLEINKNIERCGLGTGSVSIAYDGKLFACQEQDSRDTNDYFYIGDIFNGINIDKHKIILNDYYKKSIMKCEDENFCEECLNRINCTDKLCPSVSHDLFNNFYTKPKIDCLFQNFLINYCIQTTKLLIDGVKNKNFKRYLDKLYEKYKKEGAE